MKVLVDIARVKKCADVSDGFVRRTVEKTLEFSGIVFEGEVSVSVAFVGETQIRKLNATYRHKDVSTDILSFPDFFAQKPACLTKCFKEDIFLGELIVSCANVKKYATMDSVASADAFAFTLSHGVLHLLGFKHSERMFAIQDRVTLMMADCV